MKQNYNITFTGKRRCCNYCNMLVYPYQTSCGCFLCHYCYNNLYYKKHLYKCNDCFESNKKENSNMLKNILISNIL